MRTRILLGGAAVALGLLSLQAPDAQADANDIYFNCLRMSSGFDVRNATQDRYDQEIYQESSIRQQLSQGVSAQVVISRLVNIDREVPDYAVKQVKCVLSVMAMG